MKLDWLSRALGIVARVGYRWQVLHPENVPCTGGALLAANHVSCIDALLILASAGRFVRFIVPAALARKWWLGPWLRALGVIPLPAKDDPQGRVEALTRARQAVQTGELLGIFPERETSRIGMMLPFADDFQEVAREAQAPIVPVCIDGIWGSVFSFSQARFLWKIPTRLRRAVAVAYGLPLPPSASACVVRGAIQRLCTEAWPHRRRTMRPLHAGFIRTARRHPARFAMADARVPKLSFGGALMKMVFLARRLRKHWAEQSMVGILLPPSVGGGLVNLAALLAGKVPVNLNYTFSEEALGSCIRQCGLEMVISSKAFLDRVGLTLPCRVLRLEDVAVKPRLSEKLAALAASWCAPVRLLEKFAGNSQGSKLDDLATIIFSSGSTGEPKGVLLSHYNVGSNLLQLQEAFDFRRDDRFVGILPFFHSFGFTTTLMAPAILGLGVAYHPNPLEGRPVGELVRRHGLTFLMATPAFLQIYLRACQPDDFRSLRLVMVGAEKLPDWLASAFEEKFGQRPIEGYGCTECSPVVAVNTHDFQAAGTRQVGTRKGKIGRPVTGISVRIVDPESGEPVPTGQPGLLMIRGGNVMQGYLGQPEKTAEALRDGWYVSADIATIDVDGFLQITDRLSRFSKIGGEMVPHIKVEEKLHELAKVRESTFAVTAVPDAKKGERLVVLHTLGEDAIQEVFRGLKELDLPNLWIPRANQFFRVKALPYLASGKLDLRRLRETALELAAKAEA